MILGALLYDPAVHTETAVKAIAESFAQIFAAGYVPKMYFNFDTK